jgi:hypothetical protein
MDGDRFDYAIAVLNSYFSGVINMMQDLCGRDSRNMIELDLIEEEKVLEEKVVQIKEKVHHLMKNALIVSPQSHRFDDTVAFIMDNKKIKFEPYEVLLVVFKSYSDYIRDGMIITNKNIYFLKEMLKVPVDMFNEITESGVLLTKYYVQAKGGTFEFKGIPTNFIGKRTECNYVINESIKAVAPIGQLIDEFEKESKKVSLEVLEQQEEVLEQQEEVPEQREEVPGQREEVPEQREEVPEQQEEVPEQREEVPERSETKEISETVVRITCPVCNGAIRPGKKFCSKCGTKIEG